MNGFGHLQERLMARENFFSLASTIPFILGNGHIVQYLFVQKMNGEQKAQKLYNISLIERNKIV